MLQKQAKTLNNSQMKAVLLHLAATRNPSRNRVIFLLSIKAGLRAKEIAALTWSMVTDAQGNLQNVIRLENVAAKGNRGGGVIPMAKELFEALQCWKSEAVSVLPAERVVRTERSKATSAQAIVNLFGEWYRALGFDGCSSHSGRRTFITNAARNISRVGGSLRDVQALARHSSLNMTQRYIELDSEAQRRVLEFV